MNEAAHLRLNPTDHRLAIDVENELVAQMVGDAHQETT